jgi:hypothetical protein
VIEFEGTIINRNSRAKEQTLYKIIAQREAEIIILKDTISVLQTENEVLRGRKEKKIVKKKAKVNKVRRARYLQTRKGWVPPE